MNTKNKAISLIAAAFVLLSVGGGVLAASNPSVQTNAATSVQNNNAVLNGYISDMGGYSTSNVWFQWGTDTNYGNNTNQLVQNNLGQFSQTISGLSNSTLYHFRAVAQNSFGTTYGQDMTFIANNNNNGNSAIVVNAGSSLYLTSGQTGVLQGTAYSTNGNSINYSWSCTGGTLSNYNIAQPTYTAPNTGVQANYTCTLTASDNNGNSNSAAVTIYANQNGGNNGNFSVQTNSATNLSNNQATLNGYLTATNSSNNYVYFQYGLTTNYGFTTTQQLLNYSGSYTQNIANLLSNSTYHFRAVAQNSSGTIIYGQDISFTVNGASTGGGYQVGNGYLSITKQVINITSGNLSWQNSVNAAPGNTVSFSITLQGNNQDIHNVTLRDILPSGLVYLDSLRMNTSTLSGDITQGVNIGTVYANQPVIISYQATVSPSVAYGTSTLTNNVTVTSSESEAGTQTASASVVVSNAIVQGSGTGPTYVSTGLTNDFFAASFFLPLLLILLSAWLYFSGNAIKLADWIKARI